MLSDIKFQDTNTNNFPATAFNPNNLSSNLSFNTMNNPNNLNPNGNTSMMTDSNNTNNINYFNNNTDVINNPNQALTPGFFQGNTNNTGNFSQFNNNIPFIMNNNNTSPQINPQPSFTSHLNNIKGGEKTVRY